MHKGGGKIQVAAGQFLGLDRTILPQEFLLQDGPGQGVTLLPPGLAMILNRRRRELLALYGNAVIVAVALDLYTLLRSHKNTDKKIAQSRCGKHDFGWE